MAIVNIGFFSDVATINTLLAIQRTVSLNAAVPQGSILGPFLVLLYINDITDEIANNMRLFADGTSLFVVVDNNVDQATNSFVTYLDRVKQ